MLLSTNFTAKFWIGFCLDFLLFGFERFHFKANRKSIYSSKNGSRNFQNSAPFERSACFYVRSACFSACFLNFKRFQYFNFAIDFLENENLFKNLEYRFLVESTKTENVPLSYKTVKSEANVETNRMVSTKWTYHKEQSFASNYFTFLKILFQLKNLL